MALPVTRPLVSFHVQPAEEKGTTWRARLLLEALTWRWHASLLLPSIGENEAHGHADSIGLGSVVPGLVYLPGWLWFQWQYLSNFKMCTLFEIAVLLLGIHSTEILVAVHGSLCTRWQMQHFGEYLQIKKTQMSRPNKFCGVIKKFHKNWYGTLPKIYYLCKKSHRL